MGAERLVLKHKINDEKMIFKNFKMKNSINKFRHLPLRDRLYIFAIATSLLFSIWSIFISPSLGPHPNTIINYYQFDLSPNEDKGTFNILIENIGNDEAEGITFRMTLDKDFKFNYSIDEIGVKNGKKYPDYPYCRSQTLSLGNKNIYLGIRSAFEWTANTFPTPDEYDLDENKLFLRWKYLPSKTSIEIFQSIDVNPNANFQEGIIPGKIIVCARGEYSPRFEYP